MRLNRVRALLSKELRQMLRERRNLVLILVVPMGLVLLFGFAVSLDVTGVRLGLCDRDGSLHSRALVRAFVASDYFRPVRRLETDAQIRGALDAGEVSAVLVVPRGFGADLDGSRPAGVQVLLDGTDAARASIVQQHARRIVQTFTGAVLIEQLRTQGVELSRGLLPIELRPLVLYDPELESRSHMVPGLIGVLLTVVGVLQTSLALAGESERGSLEQLRMTPLRASELVLGKLLPQCVVALANACLVLVVSLLLVNTPVQPNLAVFFAGTLLFLACALGAGLLISALAPTQQGAQTVAFLGTVLPVFYLSGFVFPIRSMPAWLQAVTVLNPARYYVQMLCGSLQKGVGFAELTDSFAALTLYAVVIVAAGVLATWRTLR
jgi:ABC-2 type transport system permease protein